VYAWRSVYFAQSVSFRTRILLAMDWAKRALFGRGESPYASYLTWLTNIL
jgi:NADH dehydrogenase